LIGSICVAPASASIECGEQNIVIEDHFFRFVAHAALLCPLAAPAARRPEL
jgi:hypothetical protein